MTKLAMVMLEVAGEKLNWFEQSKGLPVVPDTSWARFPTLNKCLPLASNYPLASFYLNLPRPPLVRR
ncbi:MAG: hypothetical protein JWM43_1439 [Acidobacteriaceae bacterium]|nr:hypothetical protein [Acidobacteriaceae bacterium]